MKVKICGLQQEEHVRESVSSGADFIGFVFAPSKRNVSIEQAQKLVAMLPSTVKSVGVFVNPTKEELEETIQQVGLDIVQLHGDETAEFCASISKPVIKAFSINSVEDFDQTNDYPVDYHLVDAPGSTYRGGSGHTFDWSLIQNQQKKTSLILAGGLSVENITQAIKTVKPYAVDVSSGVETDGVKDGQKIQEFIQRAKAGSEQS
ncbi:phosphoribosylanthranilate isomerase [Jeotgalibacillus marinus]|uniref:N-(5'-phosphoribosyl)anthranilate isomerase n=1 Tax=Jeotgalibacillus marinus TaxID=86667 RepID=A0ABV3Q369_9BACL